MQEEAATSLSRQFFLSISIYACCSRCGNLKTEFFPPTFSGLLQVFRERSAAHFDTKLQEALRLHQDHQNVRTLLNKQGKWRGNAGNNQVFRK